MTLHTDCIVSYRQSNGNIIVKPRFGMSNVTIGDTTSMGWTILDVHYKGSDGNYYREDAYRKLRSKEKETLKQKIARYIIKKANKYR